jgi:uncharacterized protein (TIGR03437 family)
VISAGGALTIPDLVDVTPVQPGVAAFLDGTIKVQHGLDFAVVTPQNPAKRGEYLIMYLVGMGNTNPAVATGQPSPGPPSLGIPNTPPTVTIDGKPAEVGFAGLTPGFAGLFQINFRVPEDARLNTPLEILIKQGTATANVSTLTVMP